MSETIVRLKPRSGARGRKKLQAKVAPAHEVLQVLRERIARQDIAPGAKLREHELAAEFGVPRTRIREVFGALESRGLIERIPNRGAVVSRLELDQVFNLYDVRAVLEGLCVRQATQNAPPETWQEFVDLFGGADGRVRAGRRLRLLPRLLRALPQPLHRMRAQSGRRADARQHLREDPRGDPAHRHPARPRRRPALREHRATVAAMRAGNAEEAERLKRANIEGAKEYLRRFQKYVL